jgi:hypothetical protein
MIAALLAQARRLESDLDVKIAAYGKICSSYEYGYSKGESGKATDQARQHRPPPRPPGPWTRTHTQPPPGLASLTPQLLQSKSSEIDSLLARLSDANDAMRSSLSGGADTRSHTLARHRDILHDFTQARSAACPPCLPELRARDTAHGSGTRHGTGATSAAGATELGVRHAVPLGRWPCP